MDGIEVTAKSWQDALNDGLRQLSATIDDVNVKVIDVGGFFRDAKLVISLTEEVRRERERAQAQYERRNQQQNAGRGERRNPDGGQTRAGGQDKSEPRREENKNARDMRGDKNRAPVSDADKRGGKTAEQQQKRLGKQTESGVRPFENSKANAPKPKAERPAEAKEYKQVDNAPSEVPEETVAAVVEFLRGALKEMSMSAEFETSAHGSDLDVTIVSEDKDIVGYHGETIESLEYLATTVANKGGGKFIRVTLDCNNYRDKKIEALLRFAEKMAAKCIKTGRKVSLDPMNSATRKVIHAALSANEGVTTRSEGKEPNRRIVIYCKRPSDAKNADGRNPDGEERKDKNDRTRREDARGGKPQKNGSDGGVKKKQNAAEESAEEKSVKAAEETADAVKVENAAGAETESKPTAERAAETEVTAAETVERAPTEDAASGEAADVEAEKEADMQVAESKAEKEQESGEAETAVGTAEKAEPENADTDTEDSASDTKDAE